jgi:hypothetical protein
MELMAGRLGDHARFANHDSSPEGITRFLVSFFAHCEGCLGKSPAYAKCTKTLKMRYFPTFSLS